ncbi:reverse transcriptase domain-containing protein, partial [Tanacetum coccineum]
MLSNFLQIQSPSGSRSLPSNTVSNLRGDMKSITTRSGVSYDGPMIPPTPPLPKEVKRETEATKDKVQTKNLGRTAYVQPPVVQVPIPEPEVAPKPNPKPSIPYPLRLNDQKLREKTNNQMLNFLQIFQRLHFDISFADALLHMPKFASTFKSLLSNKELSLPELTPTRMTLKLANRPVSYPIGVAEDVFVKVGKFHFLADFVVVVPLILGRPFLRTERALIDVHGEELILRDEDENLIFHTDTTSKYPNEHKIKSVKMINFIDISCEDNFKEVLKIKKLSHHLSGSTTSTPDSSPSLTPVETSDYLLEEFADVLALLDPFPPGIGDADFDPEGDICLLEKLLNNDPSSPLPLKELNFEELKTIKSSIDDFPPLDVLGEDIESEDSYVSNLDEPDLLVTPLFDANEDECFDPGGDIDEIDAFLDIDVPTDIKDGYHDSDGDIIYLESFLINDTIPNLPPKVFLDH